MKQDLDFKDTDAFTAKVVVIGGKKTFRLFGGAVVDTIEPDPEYLPAGSLEFFVWRDGACYERWNIRKFPKAASFYRGDAENELLDAGVVLFLEMDGRRGRGGRPIRVRLPAETFEEGDMLVLMAPLVLARDP